MIHSNQFTYCHPILTFLLFLRFSTKVSFLKHFHLLHNIQSQVGFLILCKSHSFLLFVIKIDQHIAFIIYLEPQ